MRRLTTPALLIVDDLGLPPLVSDEPIDLYEIIRQRYERGSTISTSNRAIDAVRSTIAVVTRAEHLSDGRQVGDVLGALKDASLRSRRKAAGFARP